MTHSITSRRCARLTVLLLAGALACARGGRDAASDSAGTDTIPVAGARPGAPGGQNTTTQAPADSAMSGEQAGVRLELDRATYTAGASVRLRIVNGSDVTYGYNPCTRIVERREGAGWAAVQEDRACTMELRLLGARDSVDARTEMPARMPVGEYRVVLVLSRDEQPAPGPGTPAARPVRAASAPFTVR